MGISLSNHEDRIKKLEDYQTRAGKKVMLWTYGVDSETFPIKLKDSIKNYDFIIIGGIERCFGQHICITPGAIETIRLLNHKKFASGNPIDGEPNSGYCLNFDDDVTVSFIGSMNFSRLDYICGLKLYYNFSYNIYTLAVSISKSFLKCLIKIRN